MPYIENLKTTNNNKAIKNKIGSNEIRITYIR